MPFGFSVSVFFSPLSVYRGLFELQDAANSVQIDDFRYQVWLQNAASMLQEILYMPSKLGILVHKCRKSSKTATDRKMEIALKFFGSIKLTVVDSGKKTAMQLCNHIVFEVSCTDTRPR